MISKIENYFGTNMENTKYTDISDKQHLLPATLLFWWETQKAVGFWINGPTEMKLLFWL